MARMRDRLLRLLPEASRPAAEAESRLWKVICGRCRHAMSLWDIGGVRHKANRRQLTWTFGRCPRCRKLTTFRVRWGGPATAS